MSLSDMGFLVIFPLAILIQGAILAPLFKKAGKAWITAFIPIYSHVVWLQIIKKPIWWIVMLLIPIVGFFYQVGMIIELLHAFKKH
ncbi:MAG: DUF5684 domain-containing protein, partial [Flavobacteriales bacterium]